MDTVEELGGTYFYAGMERLGAGELFFWVFVDKTMQQLGVGDVGAVAAIVSGMAILPTRQKPAGAKREHHSPVWLHERSLGTLNSRMEFSYQHLSVIPWKALGER